ncbi:MAG: hypothetical protein LBD04_01500 [Synergistaceae bacterium]|nr:hypothetical protein [Synergistaceae bacterium]
MNRLEKIEVLAEHLVDRVETLLVEREEMLAEIARLRAELAERDETAVKTAQSMQAELELSRTDALRLEQEQVRVEMRLRDLNDRLIALVHGE